jgi:hypothetical protein
MGLKESRQVYATNIDFAASGAMERGGIACTIPWADGLVYYPTGSGQVPVGILLEDIEDLNPMTTPQYLQRNVSPLGSMVGIATEGEFWTDMIDTTPTYKTGEKLYLIGSGKLTNYTPGDAAVDRWVIGICLEGKDSNNYIKIRLNMYQEGV